MADKRIELRQKIVGFCLCNDAWLVREIRSLNPQRLVIKCRACGTVWMTLSPWKVVPLSQKTSVPTKEQSQPVNQEAEQTPQPIVSAQKMEAVSS